MFAVLFVALAYVALTIRILFYGLRIISFPVSIALIAIGFIAVPCWAIHHLTKPRRSAARQPQGYRPEAPAPSAAPDPEYATVMQETTFKVAGVTFKNEDGTKRQTILRHLKFGDEPYVDPDREMTLDLVETTFDDELAIEVRLNGYQVGFVPRNKISQVKAALDSVSWSPDTYNIYGGFTDEDGNRHPFGCEITISWIE